jgi:hypothetical protein
LYGSHIVMSGFEVKNTIPDNHAAGVRLEGHHNTISGFDVHHTFQNGVLVRGDYGIVEDSKVWQASRNNVDGSSPTGWASGLSVARDPVDGITDHAIMRRNTVYNNWGEGFSTFEANGTLMEDCIVYDNWQVNVYISDARNVIFQRNLVYNTPDNAVGRQGGGLWLADEVASKPRSENNAVINNLFLDTGSASLFGWTIVSGSGLTNALFANNTLVNTSVETGSINSSTRIINNIFTGGGGVPSAAGITFSNNLWQGTRPANAVGAGDVLGDPLLVATGAVTPGGLSPNYFRLSSAASPAINKATVLSAVTEDYFRTTRGTSPDIGAHEYQ